jgi:hypothetical protein
MTIMELRKLECLCEEFAALTDENKRYVLGVSQALLDIQEPVCSAPPKNQGETVKADQFGREFARFSL